MKQTIVVFLFIFLFGADSKTFSQNLVPDNSFEADTACPQAGLITYNAYWKTPTTGTPDYFDTCSSSWASSVPNNYQGSQYAYSGGAYVGVITKLSSDYKEYVQVQLTSILESGKIYCVKLYVSLSGKSAYATTGPQVYFSDSAISSTSSSYLPYSPQISSSTIISDTINWVLISGTYNAIGGEKYITIGNFYSDVNTQSVLVYPFNGIEAYYYVDNVSVVDCSNSGVNELAFSESISVYPNPSNGIFQVNVPVKKYSIDIFNIYGELILHSKNSESKIDLSNQAKGIYILKLQNEDNFYSQKIILQ